MSFPLIHLVKHSCDSKYDLNFNKFNMYWKQKWFFYLYVTHFVILIVYNVFNTPISPHGKLRFHKNVRILANIIYLIYMSFLLCLFTNMHVATLCSAISTLIYLLTFLFVKTFFYKQLYNILNNIKRDNFMLLFTLQAFLILPAVFIEIMILIYIGFKLYKIEEYFNEYYLIFSAVIISLILIIMLRSLYCRSYT